MNNIEKMMLLRELRELGSKACAILQEMTADLKARREIDNQKAA